MKPLKFLTLIVGLLLSFNALAMGDPDFELTSSGQIPKWSGGFWIRLSAQEFIAKVVEDAAGAYSGKHFLHVEHPGKNALSAGGYPRIITQPGKKYILTGKIRGNGELMLFFMRNDKEMKNRPWNPRAATSYVKLHSERWQDIRLEYVPQAEDFNMVPAFSIRKGWADIDALKLSVEEVAGEVHDAKPETAAEIPERASRMPDASGRARVSGFETWLNNGLPAGWVLDPWRQGDQVAKAVLAADEPEEFGKYALFLNGKLVMDPQVKFKDNIKGRRMRVSFYARGKGGKFKVFLREGRYGNVDYLMEVFGGETTGEWKKYSGEVALALGYVNNAAVELNGENIWIDNLEFSEVKSISGVTSYVIPMIKNPPVIDGHISGSEWEFCGGASAAFQVSGAANSATALKRQTGFKFCSDGKYLYFLFSTPDVKRLKSDADKRDSAVYSDDSVEMHINPDPGQSHPPKAYQLVFNGLGTVFDQCRINGRFSKDFHRWDAATLTVKSVIKDGVWTLEGRIALAEIGLTPEKPFSMNVCLNRCLPTALGTISGGKFEDLGAMPAMLISARHPAVYWENQDGYGNMTVKVIYPADCRGKYLLDYALDSQNATISTQKVLDASLAGQAVPFFFTTPGGAGKFGNMILTLNGGKDQVLFRQAVSFSSAMEVVPEPELPLELHVLPEQNKVAVNIYPSRRGYRDFAYLTVDGLPGKTVRLEKKELAVFDGMLFVKLPAGMLHGQNYKLRVSLFNQNGELLDSVNRDFTMDDSLILKDDAANYRGVLAPYQPLQHESGRVKVSMREYYFGGNGLPEAVISAGEKVLHAPVVFTAVDAGGKVMYGENGRFEVVSEDDEKLLFTGESIFPGFVVKLSGRMEYDGTIFYKGEISAEKPVALQRLSLDIPMNKLDYFHSYLDTNLRLWMCRQPQKGEYRHPSVPVWNPESSLVAEGFRKFVLYFFPSGDGLLWSSRKVLPGVIKDGFLPYLLFGNHRFGMEVFADTDRGWIHNQSSSVHEIFRSGGKETVRTNIVAAESTVENGRTFEFGLTVTPGREKTLTRKEDRRSYIGASHSSFMDRSCSPTVAKDAKLLDIQCAGIIKKGGLPILWMCKELYPQGDPIARYLDSEWRTRPGGKWLMHHYMPSHAYGLDPYDYEAPAGCFPASRIDFHSRRFDDLFKAVPNLMGVYWDENYMKPCSNPNHADCVYKMADGRTQGRAWWGAIREIDRRLRTSMNRYGREEGSIALFTGEGIIPHAMAFGNVNTMGEHHTHGIDYIDYWTLHCTEIMAAGAWGIDVGFLGMFYEEKDRNNIALNRAQLAIVKLFNAHFQASWIFNQQLAAHFKKIDEAFDYSLPGTVFCGYFTDENKRSVRGLPADVKASFYVHPGKNALFFITNLKKQSQKVSPQFDLSAWQIDSYDVYDAENGKPLSLEDLEIKGHDLRVIELRAK
ncbi:MAG: hypothetical protein E7050_00155 [Lentisphaerae bacterium]|nr:hypothetical protein [Lentisphaerota bacterium]